APAAPAAPAMPGGHAGGAVPHGAEGGPARQSEPRAGADPGPGGGPGPDHGTPPHGGDAPAGAQAPRAADRPEPAFEPGNRIDQELYEAALSGDSDAFLRVLLHANVLVPIPEDAPPEVTPVQREFRWDAALRNPSEAQVFTSLVRLREVLPESRFVYADFRELISVWPSEDWTMLLNPGTRIGASLRGDQVRALSEWAVRVGLVTARQEVPVPPRREAAAQAPPEELEDPVPS